MPSTYTTNLGIEKPATGEQSGTWGDTVNLNYDLFDQAINGVVSVTLASAGTSGSPNSLPITDGTVSDGRNKFIEFVDGGDLGATAYVQLTPNDAEKIVHIRNSLSGGRSVIVFQGTYNASNDFEIPNGKDVLLKFDGGGTGAVVADVFVDLRATAITTPSLTISSTATFAGVTIADLGTVTTADINGGTIDGVTIGGASAGAGTFTNLTASGTVDFNGATVSDLGTVTTADINGGTVDGVTIGGASAAAATVTDLTASGTVDFNGATVSDLGTVTTADINGGTVDGVTIGGASAGAGTFTNLTASGTVDFNGATISNLGTISSVDIDGGTIDGVTIGGASAAAATFTDLTASGTVDFSGATISGVIEVNSNSRLGLSSPSYNIDATGESSFWVDPAVAGTLLNRVTTSLSGAVVRIKDEGTLLYEHTYLGNGHIFNTYSNPSSGGSFSFAFGGTSKLIVGEDKAITVGTHRAGTLEMGNVGSAPSAAANQTSLYTESGELKVVDAAGNITVLSPHSFELIPEGPSEDMAWSYYSERDGKKINVDMLKALRILEQLSGEKLVYEEN